MATSVSPSARCAGQGQCSEFTNGHSSGGTPVINNNLAVAALTGLVMAAPAIAEARDQIRIVGSSTVFPYRSEEHTSELQSLMRISYAVFCLNQKQTYTHHIF